MRHVPFALAVLSFGLAVTLAVASAFLIPPGRGYFIDVGPMAWVSVDRWAMWFYWSQYRIGTVDHIWTVITFLVWPSVYLVLWIKRNRQKSRGFPLQSEG